MMQADNAADKRVDIFEVTDEASQADSDDIIRRARRGDESEGNPNERDAAGAPHPKDTAHGREESKTDKSEGANQNG